MEVQTELNTDDIAVDLSARLICDGEFVLPSHAAFSVGQYSKIAYHLGGGIRPYRATKHEPTGFYHPEITAFELSIPPSFALEIETALKLGHNRSLRLAGEEGRLKLSGPPDPIYQPLSDWRLKIASAPMSACTITLSAALHGSRKDYLLRKPVNYWPLQERVPQRIAVEFTVGGATRAACFGHVLTGSKVSLTAPAGDLTPFALAYPYVSLPHCRYAFLDIGALYVKIADDAIGWTDADGEVISLRGFGRRAINDHLQHARSFRTTLFGDDLAWIKRTLHDFEAGNLSPVFREIEIRGTLEARGLVLEMRLDSLQPGDSVIEDTIIVPWATLILRGFKVEHHRPHFSQG